MTRAEQREADIDLLRFHLPRHVAAPVVEALWGAGRLTVVDQEGRDWNRMAHLLEEANKIITAVDEYAPGFPRWEDCTRWLDLYANPRVDQG